MDVPPSTTPRASTSDSTPDQPTEPGHGLPLARLETFSDGVFAIAITLLVLEIAVPLGAEEDLLGALAEKWPSYLAYLISFLTIGWVWIGHAAITSHLKRADGLFLRLNLLLLLVVAFLPFPTALMAEYFGEREPERVASAFYGVVLLAIAALISVLWRYARRAKEMLRFDATDDELAELRAKSTPGIVLLLFSTAVAIVLPSIAALCFLGVSAYLVIPFREVLGAIRALRRADR
jgi:uncharacterized membrane protein